MAIQPEITINAIMKFWRVMADAQEPSTHWERKLRCLEGWEACKFFIWVMLNQVQQTSQAWAAAEEFVKKAIQHRWSPKTIWIHISKMKVSEVRDFCNFSSGNKLSGSGAEHNKREFEGYQHKRGWLRENADKIIKNFNYVENIWNKNLPHNNEEKIIEIHRRFLSMGGINNELANMAISSLVKDYGYAGGIRSRRFLKIRFDTHVNRVITRAIISGNPALISAESYVENTLNNEYTLESPDDFCLAVFKIAQDYCQYDNCKECPIHGQCNAYQFGEIYERVPPQLPIDFVNQDDRCFLRYKIISFQLSYINENSNSFIFYADEDNIKQHERGLSIDIEDELECTLQIINNNFLFSIINSRQFTSNINNIIIHPYISTNEIIFTGENGHAAVFIKIDTEQMKK